MGGEVSNGVAEGEGFGALGRSLIVVPAYNESQVLAQVLTSLIDRFPRVVVVDDGSIDGTSVIARNFGVNLITHPVNLGQGAAIMTGVQWGLSEGCFDLFATYDSDGQHRPEDLLQAFCKQKSTGVDVVLGSRFLSDSSDVPKSKRLLLKAALIQTRLATGLKVTDTHNGMRVFTAQVARTLSLSNGMSHASDFLQLIAQRRFRFAEAPVTISYTKYSKSKGQPMINAVNILFDSLTRSS